MTLDDWLTTHNIKAVYFARMVEASESLIARLRSAKRQPSLDLARRIAKATNGDVGLDDWPEPKKSKGKWK